MDKYVYRWSIDRHTNPWTKSCVSLAYGWIPRLKSIEAGWGVKRREGRQQQQGELITQTREKTFRPNFNVVTAKKLSFRDFWCILSLFLNLITNSKRLNE